MGLVDGDEGDFCLTHVFDEDTLSQPFGRDIENLNLAVDTMVEYDKLLLVGEFGGNTEGFDVTVTKLPHLVFHQRLQRRDNHR